MSRWHSVSASAPLWVPGLVLIGLGLVLVGIAARSVRRG
jgi:hypothetical protein